MGWQRFLGCLWQSFFRRHSLLRLKPAVEIFTVLLLADAEVPPLAQLGLNY
jgi:hypothetical protein